MGIITKWSEVYFKSNPETHGFVTDSRVITVAGRNSLQYYVEWDSSESLSEGWYYNSELELA